MTCVERTLSGLRVTVVVNPFFPPGSTVAMCTLNSFVSTSDAAFEPVENLETGSKNGIVAADIAEVNVRREIPPADSCPPLSASWPPPWSWSHRVVWSLCEA